VIGGVKDGVGDLATSSFPSCRMGLPNPGVRINHQVIIY
jgi:hypothetical protein